MLKNNLFVWSHFENNPTNSTASANMYADATLYPGMGMPGQMGMGMPGMMPGQPRMPGMMPGQMGMAPQMSMGMPGQMPGNSMMGGMGMPGQMGMGSMAQPSMGMSMPGMMPNSSMPGMMTGPGQHPAIPGVQPSVQPPQPAPAPAPAPVEWAIPQQKRVGYMAQFQANDKARTGFLAAVQARGVLLQTGLAQQTLATVWNLADIDKVSPPEREGLKCA